MNTRETYVSLETAELAKQAGFDWKVKAQYLRGEFKEGDYYRNYNNSDWFGLLSYSTPTLAIAQRWLREVKGISVESRVVRWFNRNQTNECTIFWRYIILSIDTSSQEAFYRIVDIDNGFEFDSYEEALEAGIKKCLEIILEKGE